jgi:hypothetical protein
MAQFVVGQPHTTEVPRIEVDAGLRPGAHRFRLVVVNGAGKSSAPDEVVVQVVETLQTPQPTAQPILRPATELSSRQPARILRRSPRTPR